ncbi:hypothetical protein SAMN05443633_108124 [Chryseobacterium arachidis]|uniref:Uncharacterized protein n=1 Tax=Chryseobacterium arachidis TaxID=1416778 RepID=A0A1M5FT18_9FLAO|nr:hypothetical protein SAMN05443633_108124 [Chryseobacterium arachidis]
MKKKGIENTLIFKIKNFSIRFFQKSTLSDEKQIKMYNGLFFNLLTINPFRTSSEIQLCLTSRANERFLYDKSAGYTLQLIFRSSTGSPTSIRCIFPQSDIAFSKGFIVFPRSVIRYSTRGGTSGYTILSII